MFLQNSFGNLTVLSRAGLVLLSFGVYVLSFKVTDFAPDFLKRQHSERGSLRVSNRQSLLNNLAT